MDKKITIGEKIKFYRKRAGLSQFELELKIDASQGSISKLESGINNPTKETIIKIVDALNLNVYEAASLFNINIKENIGRILKISSHLYNTDDLNKILQKSVNDIVFELNLLGAAIYLIDKDSLYTGTITQTWFTSIVFKILGTDFKKYKLSISKDTSSLLVKCVVEQKSQYSLYARDFIVPAIPLKTANLLQKLAHHKCGISFPIIYNNKSLGCILFSKSYVDDFSNEYDILESYTQHIAVAIIHSEEYLNAS